MDGVWNRDNFLVYSNDLFTLLTTCYVHLVKAPVTLTPQTTIDVLQAVEADYDGYGSGQFSNWSGPYTDRDGGISVMLGTASFQGAMNVLSVTNNIYGWWIDDGFTQLYAAQMFDHPYPIAFWGEGLPLVVTLNLFRVDRVYSNYK